MVDGVSAIVSRALAPYCRVRFQASADIRTSCRSGGLSNVNPGFFAITLLKVRGVPSWASTSVDSSRLVRRSKTTRNCPRAPVTASPPSG